MANRFLLAICFTAGSDLAELEYNHFLTSQKQGYRLV